MAVLVGIYLIQGDASNVARLGKASWAGTWTLFRSPRLNRKDWEPLTSGETSSRFASPAMAARAGEDEGVAFARQLQSDDGLEPMAWEAVSVRAAPTLHRSCAGGRC